MTRVSKESNLRNKRRLTDASQSSLLRPKADEVHYGVDVDKEPEELGGVLNWGRGATGAAALAASGCSVR